MGIQSTKSMSLPVASYSSSYLAIVWRQFVRNRAAVVGLVLIVVFILTAIFAPLVVSYDPYYIAPGQALKGPSALNPLGTDELGRDVLSRILIGARITLVITIAAVSLALLVGAGMGLIAGFYGGRVDTVIMRAVDVLMAMPGFLLAIGIIAALGVGTTNVILAVGIYSIPTFARIARASTLSVKTDEYVTAAKSLGASEIRVMLHHVLPNIMPPLIVQTSLRMATAILNASSLSFLGLGPQPPTPEWGAMLSAGRDYMTRAPLLVAFPGLAILTVTLSFNLLGDGLRDSLDPRLKR
ncbi:MAG: ABC transporter permease [Chloroflexota bacterium]|jgi:peptide/nickel transport system permease protein